MVAEDFSPAVREWFRTAFESPTPAQERGWPAISSGEHTLILAPTGSGKTLAAFLWGLDRLADEPVPPAGERTRLLYISPLRALAVDVEKNLRAPLAGIGLAAERLGDRVHEPTVGMRTGDTPANERRQLLKTPPDILITTPESLYLMLTSGARETLRSVRWVIVDEIHALAATKRGSHLSLSLERLEEISQTPPQRIGLSATQRPLEEIARFLGGSTEEGPRPVTIVDAGHRKQMEVEVVVPVEDMGELGKVQEEDWQSGPAASGPTRTSIWPAIDPELLELIRAHRSTLIFANARRLAERLAARLNDLAGEELVRAHHGSLSREQRMSIEDQLKSGTLKGLVATSSLELGIDMGAIDLVIQVESPGSVARGLQRIGRAGHKVGEPSRGKLFPKYRGDLLEAAVVVRRMQDGLIEETRYPRNPLDVLAQQIVAMCAVDEWRVGELLSFVRRAAPYADLSEEVFTAVLDLLSGRYPSDEFAELRPRLVWDRRKGTVRAREGAGRLAITSGGTIPDRGLFGVFLPDGKRVGELDEEMVYESRTGEVFLLGASAWRIEDITVDRVIVSPAPGEPGKMPFWHGDKPGRPLELGRALGGFTREIRAETREHALSKLRGEYGLDELAAENLLMYLDEQMAATGAVPDDRTIVIERFPDEIGDWRVCILSPFGARVHAPWAMAIEARLAQRGMDVQMLWSDDGIVLRLPEAEESIPVEDLLIEPEEVEELVVGRLPQTALFASLFRESAARALLLPRRYPGKRTPLWQQRQRAADLLSVAGKYPTFPILLETTRECLRDVFDLPALRQVLTDLRARRIRATSVETSKASPFAQSLLFQWIGAYMYEGDAPPAERRAAALSLDRDLLRELLGAEELRELIDPAALDSLELELQGLADDRRARGPDGVHDLLRRVGDLTEQEIASRSVHGDIPRWIAQLLDERRAIRVRVAGEERIAAVEDAARLRDALGVTLQQGLPDVFTEPTTAPLESLVARFARTHGPFLTAELARRVVIPIDRATRALEVLQRDGRIVLGEFRPGGAEREWCDIDVLRMLRRRSLAALRKEVEPVDAATLGRFLPAWHGIGAPRQGTETLVEAIGQLQGAAVPASLLEAEILPARVPGFRAADLDALTASGDLVWVGAGRLGTNDGRVALYFRDRLRLLAPQPSEERPEGAVHYSLREHLASRGASFWIDLVAATGIADERVVLAALWDLAWAGEITNDTLAPLRAAVSRRMAPAGRRPRPRPGALRRAGPPAGAGRWSLVAPLLEPEPRPTEVSHARALQLLDRHGIVTREGVLAEGVPGGFAAVYGVLKALEEQGRVRRGYFVSGLGAAQFALPGAVDRLRDLRDRPDGMQGQEVIALSATDPAQPYGAALPWPEGSGRPARAAGSFVVLSGGAAAAYLERGARSLLTFEAAAETGAWVDALIGLVKEGRVRKLELQRIDGVPASESPLAERLRDAGFADGYRGLTVRG
jgi:ATP-dependent helicase Lhr and Lhr-like helicase